jgi:hypothetical protein
MKLPITSLILAFTMVTANAQAKTDDFTVLYKSGSWSTYKSFVTPNNKLACNIDGSIRVDGGRWGLINFKTTGSGGILYFIISKEGWRFPREEKDALSIPLELTFNNSDMGIGVEEARGYMGGPKNEYALVDFFVRLDKDETFLPRFMEAFAHADNMLIKFKSGNEAVWSFDMRGSRGAANAFSQCVTSSLSAILQDTSEPAFQL